MFKLALLLVLATAFTSQVMAYGAPPSGVEMFHRRQRNAIVCYALQKRCGVALAKCRSERMRKRAYAGLTEFKRGANDSVCLLTREVTQDPYHILEELVRQNITQGQDERASLPAQDVEADHSLPQLASQWSRMSTLLTLTPVSKVWVDGWSCSATGIYSGYEAASSLANTGGTDAGSAPPDTSGVPSGDAGQPSGAAGAETSTAGGAYAGADSPSSGIAGTAPGDSDNFLHGV